jgi:O-antigen/teichoic acid export membrane protein
MPDESKKAISGTSRATDFARIAKNALANLARLGASWVVVLCLPPLLVRVLDKPTYATWVLILQIGAYVSLFDNGIQAAISRFAARANGLQDQRSMQQILSSAGFVLLIASLLTVAITLLCSWQFHRIFYGIPPSVAFSARRALLATGVSLAISLPFSTFAGAFLGMQMNEVNALAGSSGRLVGAAGAGWAAWHHEGLLAMALWIGFGNLLQSAIFFASWKRLGLHGFFHRAHVSGTVIREFAHFCYAMFATQLGGLLITGMDMPIVAAFDFHAAAFYAVAATASTMLSAPQGAIVGTLIPVASGRSTIQTPEQLGELVIRTTRYANAILCLLTLPLLFAMFHFLCFWVGVDYAVHALPLAVILVVAQFVRLTLVPYATIGFGAGQQRRMLISPFGEGVVNLGCSVLGALWLGAQGVALGTLVGAFFGVFLHFANSMPRTEGMKFSRRRLAIAGIFKPVSCCSPSLFLLTLSARTFAPRAAGLAVVLACEILAAVALWIANFDHLERSELIAVARRMFGSCFRR